MISDVPIGFCLSGGVDSSSVVYFAEKNTSAPLKTFCMGFDEDDDEFTDAQLVADELGTEHHDLIIRKSLLKDTPKMIWHADTPKSNLCPYYVAELARKHVKVVLTDLGADELFAGYNWKCEYARQLEASHNVSQLKLSLEGPSSEITDKQFTALLKNMYARGDKAQIYAMIQSADRLFPGRVRSNMLSLSQV